MIDAETENETMTRAIPSIVTAACTGPAGKYLHRRLASRQELGGLPENSITIDMVIFNYHQVKGDRMRLTGRCFVVTADIIGSRKVEGAPALAGKGLSRVNRLYGNGAAVQFTLYRGDEIQGVLPGEEDLIRFIRRFRFSLRPLALRVGVGCGDITAGRGSAYSWQMDGSAFHYSRAALETIRSNRAPATCFAGDGDSKWHTVNAFYRLLDAVQNRWSEKQWRAVDAYERCGTFEAAARELNISPQNVYKRCRAANWKAVAEAEKFLAGVVRGGLGGD